MARGLDSDVNRQDTGAWSLEQSGWEALGGGSWTSWRETGTETMEPIAKGMNADASELARFDVSQAREAEISRNGRPVDLARRLSHDENSGQYMS
jgi:hypothetical protein